MRATDGRALPSADVRGGDSGRTRRAERTESLEALVELAASVSTLDQRGRSLAPPEVADRENWYRNAGPSEELAASLAHALAPAVSSAGSAQLKTAGHPPLERLGRERTSPEQISPSRRLSRVTAVVPPHDGWRRSYRLGLLVILAIQVLLTMRLVWSNTAFADEAEYLWYGHMEWSHWLHGAVLPTYYLSGAPQVYPPLGALADSVGGLAAARLLSLAFMLGATALLYGTASRIFGKRSGLIAAAMFVAVGPTIDMSAWATYDPMAIFMLALATWLAVRAARSRASEVWIILATVAMLLADATKWAAGLWNPVIVALVVLTAPTGWALAAARGARMLCYATAVAAPMLFVFGGSQYLTFINATTTQRGTGGNAEMLVLWTAAPMIACVLVLALLAVALSWRERDSRHTLMCGVLALAVTLAPLYQAHIQTSVSLYKHVVYGVWFGAIAVGYVLSKAVVVNAAKGWRVGLAAAIFTGLVGFDQTSGWYGYWPNSTPLLAAVQRQLPAGGRILMQDGDQMVANYYLLRRGLQPSIMTSYAYTPDAISKMIESRYVSMVETDTGTGTPPGSLQESVVANPREMQRAGYRRVAHIRWRDPNGAVGWFTVWVLGRGTGSVAG